MNSNWVLYNKKQNIKEISQKFGITPLTSVILCNRDIKDFDSIKKILSDDINDINDEKLLPDIDNACKILYEALKAKKNIRIVGDYDIDGVCSTYILYDSIKKIGGNISYAIPDRITDGYGINISIIDKAIKDKVDLIITCDNGIAAGEQISYAKKNGIDVIVTDHHDIGDLPKDALAIVDPKRNDIKNDYPFFNICGGVVAWKFITRFYDLYGNEFDKSFNRNYIVDNYLEFAMLATIGDVMPLIDENHIIAKLGLKKILNTKNKGLKKLLDISGIDFESKGINAYHIGFIIGPLINAAGRMDKATIALELFLAEDYVTIDEKAETLKKFNDDRKAMTENGYKLAIAEVETKYKNDSVLVVFVDGLGEQVAGIVAGRVKEKYNKPTIILTNTAGEDEAKASCRSIDAYDIFASLSKHKEMFLKFGGHKLAAGFSMLKKDIDKLRIYLNEESTLTEKDFVKKIHIDVEFPFKELSEEVIQDIEKIEPYGQNFEKPVFAERNVKTSILNVYGTDRNVVKLSFEKDCATGRGVIFADSIPIIERLKQNNDIDILYYPKINEFKGYRNIEINVIDYR